MVASLAVASAPFATRDALSGSTTADRSTAISSEDVRARTNMELAGLGVPIAEQIAAAAPGERVIVAPAEFDAPPSPSAPPPAALQVAPPAAREGGTWAVMIGINDYPGSGSDLRASVADANDVDAALGAYGVPADRRLVIRDRQASAATIRASLRWLVDHAAADSTVVFFYAGHIRKLRSGSEAIVGADGNLVTDHDVAALLSPLASQRVWIALAACFAGGFSEVLAPGRILTGAADAQSLAYENSEYGRSYLVEFMVRRAMLQGQAPNTVEQSYAWAYAELQRQHPNRMPVQYDSFGGELALGPAPARAAAPPPSPPTNDQPQPAPGEPSSPPKDDDQCVITLGSLLSCDD